MIVTSNSYSSNVGLAIEVVTALYKAGALLLIYDAEKLLRILREGDYVAAGSRFISHIWAIKKKVLSMNCPGNMNARMMRFGFDSRTIPSNCFPCRMAARGAGELHRLTGL